MFVCGFTGEGLCRGCFGCWRAAGWGTTTDVLAFDPPPTKLAQVFGPEGAAGFGGSAVVSDFRGSSFFLGVCSSFLGVWRLAGRSKPKLQKKSVQTIMGDMLRKCPRLLGCTDQGGILILSMLGASMAVYLSGRWGGSCLKITVFL